MKRTYSFVRSIGTVGARTKMGQIIQIPVFPGILKHPTVDALPGLLAGPAVVRKYTIEALRIAAWPLLRQFPREWLLELAPQADIRPGRLRALEYLLS